ncbi:electron transport complex subunit RsxC [Arenimonas sp.]|uniref:electron transport complex subunit RsxC n=1 Tax=Arenimonas sp. TaxID=1872635 RepID=UPI0039E4D34E
MDAGAPLRLHRFHGGSALAGHKAESVPASIRACPSPPVLSLRLRAPYGGSLTACVLVGQRVRAGERIADATGRAAALHAPASGEVIAVTDDLIRIRVVADGENDAALRLPSMDVATADAESLRARIAEAGIVGLGGAGFPAAEKLASAASAPLLIVNGAECEPWIACDDALLREQAADVVRGTALLAQALGAGRALIAVEDQMVEAWTAVRDALATGAFPSIAMVPVPTVYPTGGERQLIEVLTGRQVPSGGWPSDIGVTVHNVGTAFAAWRAVAHGEVLTHRIVTVTGPGVAKPGNYRVPVGTPVEHLIAQAGGYTPAAARLLLGGPLMGEAQADDSVPIEKQHGCVLVLGAADLRDETQQLPCIRCGDCARDCPAQLQPQELFRHWRANNLDRAGNDGLFDCIECGCCDLVCPSHIPLTQRFREAKQEISAQRARTQRADDSRRRFEARNARLARDAAERAQRDADRSKRGASADAVAAAIERAKAKRQAPKDDRP